MFDLLICLLFVAFLLVGYFGYLLLLICIVRLFSLWLNSVVVYY